MGRSFLGRIFLAELRIFWIFLGILDLLGRSADLFAEVFLLKSVFKFSDGSFRGKQSHSHLHHKQLPTANMKILLEQYYLCVKLACAVHDILPP